MESTGLYPSLLSFEKKMSVKAYDEAIEKLEEIKTIVDLGYFCPNSFKYSLGAEFAFT